MVLYCLSCPSVCLSVCLSVRLFVCLFAIIREIKHLSVCLSVCQYIYFHISALFDCNNLTAHNGLNTKIKLVCLSVCLSVCLIVTVVPVCLPDFLCVSYIRYPPFFDDNPFGIYEKILAGHIDWPRHMEPVAKSAYKAA